MGIDHVSVRNCPVAGKLVVMDSTNISVSWQNCSSAAEALSVDAPDNVSSMGRPFPGVGEMMNVRLILNL